MELGLSSVIVIALMSLILCSTIVVLVFFLAKMTRNQTQSQMSLIRDLTNLAASKDLTTYSQLHALANQGAPSHQSDFEDVALDDISMARRLAEQYAEHGRDPGLAFAKDDDPVNDFGGPTAFMN